MLAHSHNLQHWNIGKIFEMSLFKNNKTLVYKNWYKKEKVTRLGWKKLRNTMENSKCMCSHHQASETLFRPIWGCRHLDDYWCAKQKTKETAIAAYVEETTDSQSRAIKISRESLKWLRDILSAWNKNTPKWWRWFRPKPFKKSYELPNNKMVGMSFRSINLGYKIYPCLATSK